MPKHQLVALTVTCLLFGCGGGGGGGGGDQASGDASSGGTGNGGATSASTTPMANLTVPASMTWQTAATPNIQVLVLDENGASAEGAAVSMFTYSTVSPNGGGATQPVAMALMDAALSDQSGAAHFTARVPAHLTSVMIVATKSTQSGRAVVAVSDLTQPVTISMAP